MSSTRGHIASWLTALMLPALYCLCSCDKDPEFQHPTKESMDTGTPMSRPASKETRRALILYSSGFNSLSFDLKDDIEDLLQSDLPGNARNDDLLLIFAHHVTSTYDKPSEPVLFRAWKKDGVTVRDTLKTWPAGTVSASSDRMKEVLTYIKDNFPAKEYHLLFSSHATGWLPPGFYVFDTSGNNYHLSSVAQRPLEYWSEGPFNTPELEQVEGEPRTKTLGETRFGTNGHYEVYEMDLRRFAKSIPMHLNSLLFDCCLMGCAEVAYELKDVCDRMVVSPAEVLSDGFDYKKLYAHLFKPGVSDVKSVAEDYFAQYESRTGVNQSATVAMVDCRYMDELAVVCKAIFAAHRENLDKLNGNGVQQYHRYDFNCFYDLLDVVRKIGASETELAELGSALDKAVPYKAATPAFMLGYHGFRINCYSGLSVMLPAESDARCQGAYYPLGWNVATELLK